MRSTVTISFDDTQSQERLLTFDHDRRKSIRLLTTLVVYSIHTHWTTRIPEVPNCQSAPIDFVHWQRQPRGLLVGPPQLRIIGIASNNEHNSEMVPFTSQNKSHGDEHGICSGADDRW